MIAPKVKTANNRLQQLYFNNLIVYPRVELSYSTFPQSLLSHKPLPTSGAYFEPFYDKDLVFNKMTSLLFLNTTRLITPSITSKISKDIDEFFGINMEPKKEKELKYLIEAKDIFLSNSKLELMTSDKPSFFKPAYFELFVSHRPKIKKVKIQGLSFSSPKKKRIEELEQRAQQKISYDDTLFIDVKSLKKFIEINNERYNSEEQSDTIGNRAGLFA